MAIGLARPEAPQHRHQDVGLVERQSGFIFADLAGSLWHVRPRLGRWEWLGLGDLHDRGRELDRGRFF